MPRPSVASASRTYLAAAKVTAAEMAAIDRLAGRLRITRAELIRAVLLPLAYHLTGNDTEGGVQ